MTKPAVYVETSIVSYLTARRSQNLVVAAQQAVTREWWHGANDRFALVASELVFAEAAAGDADAARGRLTALALVKRLNTTEEAAALTRKLLELGVFPREAAADAAHVGVAAAHGIDYLVTWNIRHIANASVRARIERACRQAGHEPPVICTPSELMDEEDHEDNAYRPDSR